jgi:hypothetical protein
MRHFEATDINASGALGFPHCGKGTDRDRTRFSAVTAWSPMMALHRKAARAGKTATRKTTPKRWSQRVTRESDALDLKRGVFTLRDPKKIAASLKRSAERSSRRKAGAYRSALSMLTFYINRAGRTLPKTQRDRLQRAKVELKRMYGRE